MIHFELPTTEDLLELGVPRANALSIYLPTEPTPEGRERAVVGAKSAVDEAIRSMRAAGLSHSEQEAMRDQWSIVADDTQLWRSLSRSLVIFIAPDFIDEYVLPNALEVESHFGDRFAVGQLVRAVTTPQRAFALTLSSDGWNLWTATESSRAAELPLSEDYPDDLADATNRSTSRGRQYNRRLGGDEGQKVLLDRYAQLVARAVTDELALVDPTRSVPLFVFANDPLSSMVVAHGLPGEIVQVPGAADELRPDQIDAAIREQIGEITTRRLDAVADKIGDGFTNGLASTDVVHVARAAALGAVRTLYYDLTADVRGNLDAETGVMTYDPNGEDLLAALALAVLAQGGDVYAVRPGEISANIWNGQVLASLRHALI